MDCNQKVLDIFVTKPDDGYSADQLDETYMAPVWSIDVVGEIAIVANWSTHWIMSCDASQPLDLEVGDMVRIGSVATNGYTDYVTVLEKKPVAQITNGIVIPAFSGTVSHVTHPNGSTDMVGPTPGTNNANVVPRTIAHSEYTPHHPLTGTVYAYRISMQVDATTPPTLFNYKGYYQETELIARKLADRHDMRIETSWADTTPRQKLFPLFRVNKWLPDRGEITLKLDHGVKQMHWLKLVGYSVFNRRQSGFESTHEIPNDDWYALRINEISGDVVSNNAVANGSFCVLHTGSTPDNVTGGIEYHTHDIQGLHTHYFGHAQSAVRQLTFKVFNRLGNPADFGRIHLWFKVCVSHG